MHKRLHNQGPDVMQRCSHRGDGTERRL